MIGLTSPTHLALLLLIALLLFGAKRLPEIGRSLGERNARVQGVRHARDRPARVDRDREDRLMRPRRLPREEEATLVEHLEELRGRIIVSLAAVAVATAVAFAFHDHILEWLARPLPPGAPPTGGVRRDRAVLGLGHREPVRRAPLRAAGDPLAAVVVPGSGARPCGRAPDSPPRRLRCSCSGRRASPSATGPAPARRALAHELRHDELPHPDPGEQLLLVRRHGAARRRLSSSRRRSSCSLLVEPRRAHVEHACAGTGGKGYFIVAVAALALPGPDPVTTLLELLPMWALFEGSIWLAVLAERRAARGLRSRERGMTRAEWKRLGGFSAAVVLLHVARLRPVPLLRRSEPGARGARRARVHVRAAARVRRRPHRGDRQHDAQAPAGRASARSASASSSRSATRRSSSRSPPGWPSPPRTVQLRACRPPELRRRRSAPPSRARSCSDRDRSTCSCCSTSSRVFRRMKRGRYDQEELEKRCSTRAS